MTFSFEPFPTTIMLHMSHPYHGILEHFPFHIDLFRVVPRHFPAHRHNFLETSFVVDGEGYQMINGVRYEMVPGTFFFLLPYQVHEIFTLSKQSIKIYNCMFDMNLLFHSAGSGSVTNHLLFSEENLVPSLILDGEARDKIGNLFSEMMMEFRSDHLWKNHILQAKLTELVVHFDRLRGREEKRSLSDSSSIWLVIRHIHQHYQDPLTLSELASSFRMSASHLSQEFKKNVGMNFIQFLHEVRTSHACSLLSSTNLSGIDIAMEVGFGSTRSFSRIFREVKGMSPNEYRKRFRLNLSENVQ